jgi:hypothetical protein
LRRPILALLPFVLSACPPPVIGPIESSPVDDSDTQQDSVDPPVDGDSDGYTECRAGDDPLECDCDDTNALINPGVQEIWYDGADIDENCDDNTADQDEDGFVWWGMANGQDCDDLDQNIHPDVTTDEPYDGVDADCDRHCDYDSDSDGEARPESQGAYQNNVATAWDGTFTYCESGEDCDDSNPEVNSSGDEVFDSVDNDCNDDTEDLDGYPDAIEVQGPAGDSAFGHFMGAVDVDGDAHDELWIGGSSLIVGSDGANLAAFAGTSVSYASDAVKVVGPDLGPELLLADLNRDGAVELLTEQGNSVLVMTHAQLSGGNLNAEDLTARVTASAYLLNGGFGVVDNGTDTVLITAAPSQGVVVGHRSALVMSGTNDTLATFIISGAETDDQFGSALATVDIINGDGIPDVLIGSPYDDTGASNGGAVYVLDGALVTVSTTRDITTLNSIVGNQSNHRFGSHIMPVGDFDGDGEPDVAIMEVSSTSQVTWRLVKGNDSGVFTNGSSLITPAIKSTWDGQTGLVAHYDLDEDGKDEVFIGSPNDGCVMGFSGQTLTQGSTFTIGNADAVVCGGTDFGTGLAVGDISADGLPDLIVAEPGSTPNLYILPTGANWSH